MAGIYKVFVGGIYHWRAVFGMRYAVCGMRFVVCGYAFLSARRMPHSARRLVRFINRHPFTLRMGRIKTQLVKRKTYELLRKFRDKFTSDFDTNKQRVNELIPGASKKLRNIIAGYLTRLIKRNQDSA